MNAQTAFLVTCESIWPPNESLHTNWHFSKLALTSMALIFPLLLSIDSNAVYSYLREELRQWWPWHFHDTKITHTSHAIADSDPDTIFFQVFFCVVLYGLFHGLCYLPVLLSAIGPSPYESAKSHEQKSGRLSPVHPAGLPGDNVSYEMAVSNGRKTPLKNGRHSAKSNTQNGGYPVPPTDYEGKKLKGQYYEFFDGFSVRINCYRFYRRQKGGTWKRRPDFFKLGSISIRILVIQSRDTNECFLSTRLAIFNRTRQLVLGFYSCKCVFSFRNCY